MKNKIAFNDGASNKLVWALLLMFYGGVFTGSAGTRRDLKGWDRETYIEFFIGIGICVIGFVILFFFLYKLSDKDIEIDKGDNSESEKQPTL